MSDTQIALVAEAEALYRAGEDAALVGLLAPVEAEEAPDARLPRLLGLARLRLGETEAGLALLRWSVALDPADPWGRLHLGYGLQASGQHEAALEEMRLAVSLRPADPVPLVNLAAILLSLQRPREAGRAARRATLRAPRLAAAQYTLGLARLAEDRLAEAEYALGAAVLLAPDMADAWLQLSGLYTRTGRPERAAAAEARAKG